MPEDGPALLELALVASGSHVSWSDTGSARELGAAAPANLASRPRVRAEDASGGVDLDLFRPLFPAWHRLGGPLRVLV